MNTNTEFKSFIFSFSLFFFKFVEFVLEFPEISMILMPVKDESTWPECHGHATITCAATGSDGDYFPSSLYKL